MTATVDHEPLDLSAEAATSTPSAEHCPGRHRRTVLLSLVLLSAWAVVCAGVLETSMWWSEISWPLALVAVISKPLDVVLVLVVLLLLWCLTGRLWASLGLLLGLTAGLAAVNVAKMSILTEPLLPNDYQFLSSPSFLIDMVRPGSLLLAAAGYVLLAAGTVVASRHMGRRYPRMLRSDHPRGWAAMQVARVVGGAVLIGLLASALSFNEPSNPWRRLYDAGGATWQPFSQAMNYRTNGFVGGALYNMPSEPMPMPSDYGPETMREITQRYAERATQRNLGRTPGALDDVNVVLVLSEAFADLSRLDGMSVSRDTMPLTRETMTSSWGGTTLAHAYATGTSAMEFEALTGQSLGLFRPQVTAPYQNFMTGLDSYPSAVGWFAQAGHLPIAVHPYLREFYRRDAIYPMLGFQDFVDEKTITEKDRLQDSRFISDQASFDEVERQIAEHEEPLLVNLVTMQNHVPTTDAYADPVPADVPGGQEYEESVAGYARGQEYTDGALREFLGHLAAGPEPTVVVFYGDHYPGVLPDQVLDANPGLGQLTTPMFIWSSEGQSPRSLPMTSPAAFLPLVFDLLSAPLPPYYELLTAVADQVGAIGPGRIVTPDGREITEADLTPAQQQLLHDYRLVQYDFSIGERYAVDDMWYAIP